MAGESYSDRMGSSGTYIRPQMRRLHDPDVTFEEYRYYATKTREAEEVVEKLMQPTGILDVIFPTKKAAVPRKDSHGHGVDSDSKFSSEQEKSLGYRQGSETDPPLPTVDLDGQKTVAETTNTSKAANRAQISDEDWINASRAVRTATAAACFYLITTDILGPFGLPYAFATTGWGPGVALFTVFGALAGYSGYLLWDIFMGMDSYQFPLRSYGDSAYRVYGQWARIPFNILQAIQLIASVGIIIISNGQALSVSVQFKFCYVGCLGVLAVVGMVGGQIRTLQKFGWLANVAVFINVLIMFITMGVAAHSPPNYSAASFLSAGASLGDGSIDKKNGVYPPVEHHGGLPVSGDFIGSVNGIMQAVYAYGGAMLFNEFMAEMRRPRDFLKGMFAAQTFIWFVYMLYGLFIYGYQGQYTINPSPQTISPYAWLVVANVLYILSATIAACLYGNIGVKVIYNNIFVELFHLPPLTHPTGKILWIFMIPIYWAVAFAIGGGIPNFNSLVGVISAFCVIQFTYSFPPLLHLGYLIQSDATLPDQGEGFDPLTGRVTRVDRGLTRLLRGLLGGSWKHRALKCWNILYLLGALALAGLGAYSSISLIIESFAGKSAANAFTCKSPLDFQNL